MNKNVINAGIAFVKSLKSILLNDSAIITPTIINTAEVACVGIAANNGAKNKDIKNKNPVVIAVNPVLPPSPTPDALSTKAVTVEVPSNAPTVVPIASDNIASLALGIFPFSSSKLPFSATPTKHPTVSNKSTNSNVNTNITIFKLNISLLSTEKACKNTGFNDGISKDTIPVGKATNLSTIPIIDIDAIDINNAPFTFLATNTPVINKPTKVNITNGSCILPKAPSTTILALLNPTYAINNPTPAVTANFKFIGIHSIIFSLKFVTVSKINIIPSINTAIRANCHEYPICKTIVFAKKTFNPIPGANPIG